MDQKTTSGCVIGVQIVLLLLGNVKGLIKEGELVSGRHPQLVGDGDMIHNSSRTCIDFQEDPTAGNRIHIKYDYKRNGCWSDMGVQGGVQNMWLGKGCLHMGPIIHEMVHTLGIGHMHNRDDRDDYIQSTFHQ
ncbi:astacin [Cooperia oncophora]